MVRSGLFQGLRRRGAVLGAVLAYALLLNALIGAVFNVQAVAAALDPLTGAARCDTSGAADPARHETRHQPDCTLCSAACPMAGMVQGLGDGMAAAVAPPDFAALDLGTGRATGIKPPSIFRSDAHAQAPPTIG